MGLNLRGFLSLDVNLSHGFLENLINSLNMAFKLPFPICLVLKF